VREMIISQRVEELIVTDSFAEMTDTRVLRANLFHLLSLRGASIDLLKRCTILVIPSLPL
jgi:hypothetical protein